MDNKQLFDLMMALLFVTFLLGLSTTTVIFALSFYFRKLDKFLLNLISLLAYLSAKKSVESVLFAQKSSNDL